MNSVSRKIDLVIPIVLLLILLTSASASLQPTSYLIQSSGSISYSGYVFYDDFETGDFSKWDKGAPSGPEGETGSVEYGMTLTNDPLNVYSGGWSAHAPSEYGTMPCARHGWLARNYPVLYTQAKIMWDITEFQLGKRLDLLKVHGQTYEESHCVRGVKAAVERRTVGDEIHIQWCLAVWMDTNGDGVGELPHYYSTQQMDPTPNTWYTVEIMCRKDAVNGEGRMWINGVELTDISQVGVDTSDQANLNQHRISAQYNTNTATGNVYYDEVIVDDAYIG